MRHTMLRVSATLLGLLGALSAALAVVLAALWVMDQSGITADLPTLVAAIGLGAVAAVAFLARRALVAGGAAEPGDETATTPIGR
jgi:hypothetical protein